MSVWVKAFVLAQSHVGSVSVSNRRRGLG
jgi:hypothetical protein